MAQEVEAAAQALNYNFSGVQAPPNDESLYSLRYAEFVVPLVKAVQELAEQQQRMQSDLSRPKLNTSVDDEAIISEIHTHFPELIDTNIHGSSFVEYAQVTVALLDAHREQQARIDALESTVEALGQEHESMKQLQSQVTELTRMLEAMQPVSLTQE
jgi:hypothetical protein